MNNKRYTPRALIITAVLTLAATLALTLGALALTAWLRLGPGGLAVVQSLDLIDSKFPGEYDAEAVSDGAIRGMVDALGDRWTLYLTPEEYELVQRGRANAYVGVGLTYTANETNTALEVVGLVPGGPAEQAGILVGDTITAIGGQAITPENLTELVASIGAEDGRAITFTVLSADGVSRQVIATTGSIETDPAAWAMLEGDVGYLRLANFYHNSAASLREGVEDLIAQGARAIVFDVRSNPGGYVSQVTEMLDYLLPEGPIFAQRTKTGAAQVTYSDPDCIDLPMAVLINGESYSAAELFAAQLKESVGATLVGEPTVGKGYYQQAYRLVDGSVLNLSSGLYTTGGGASLIGVGLTPDIVEPDLDAQVDRAADYLREKLR